VGGGLTISAAFRAVKNTPGSVLTATKTANMGRKLVRDNSPRKLKNRNLEALKGMGVSEQLADTLLDNYSYDPEAETRLVTALEAMNNVVGREDVVARASLATSRNDAGEMRDWVELIAAYHERVTPASALVVISSAIFIVDKSNTIHGIFPTDYIVWTPDQAQRVRSASYKVRAGGYTMGPIYATGKVDPKVEKLLLESGWARVQQDAENILRSK
jgi:hypothetical protein